jgi:hypothetical protein
MLLCTADTHKARSPLFTERERGVRIVARQGVLLQSDEVDTLPLPIAGLRSHRDPGGVRVTTALVE